MNVRNSLYSQPNLFIAENKRKKEISFEKAYVNILSMSDNHGRIIDFPNVLETILQNFQSIFPSHSSENTLNIFSHLGDLVINPMKKGYVTNPDLASGDIQVSAFEKLISCIKERFRLSPSKKEADFVALYTPGNHCFEGGVKWLLNKIKGLKAQTVLTNVKFEEGQKIPKYKIYSVRDDQNPNLQHKLLVLGLTPPNLEFYVPKPLLKDARVIDSCKKQENEITEEDLKGTIAELRKIIEEFKRENPKGGILLNSHIGRPVINIITRANPEINLILNGHVHGKSIGKVNGVRVINHGENNEFERATRLYFDDDGDLSIQNVRTFYTQKEPPADDNPLLKYISSLLTEDVKPKIQISGLRRVTDLSERYVSFKNNSLANYVTDVIHQRLKQMFPKLNASGVISSTFRGGLKDDSCNLEILKVLDGSIESLSEMHVANLKGSDLLRILYENIQANLKSPERNSIIQWAGIRINKMRFKAGIKCQDSKRKAELMANSFRVMTQKRGLSLNVPIDPNATYQIALPYKFVAKYCPQDLIGSFSPTGLTMNTIFMDRLKKDNYHIQITPSIANERIIC